MSVSNFGGRNGHEMKKLALFGLMGLAVSAGANLRACRQPRSKNRSNSKTLSRPTGPTSRG